MSNNVDKAAIRKWMQLNLSLFVDECDEVDLTSMVEEWDRVCGSGGDTTDPNHIAWDVASNVADERGCEPRSLE
jgi:hypothetical protein